MTPHRIDGVDAAFLAAETPEWHFHVSALQILDPTDVPGFGFARYRELLVERLPLVPQLRWRLRPPPLRIGWSYFVDSHELCVDEHLHRVGVAAPGGPRELAALVGDLVGHKVERDRPLWEMWFIEGLEGGRVGVLTKIHHSIIDGVSGVDVFAALSDLTPEVTHRSGPAVPVAEPDPSGFELAVRNTMRAATLPVRALRFGRDLVGRTVSCAPAALSGEPAPLPFQAPRSPYNGRLSPRRAVAVASLPLGVVKQVRAATRVKVNDIVLAVCSGVLREHLLATGALPAAPLIAQVPVSTRTDASRAVVGTQVGSMFVSLATDAAEPRDRLCAIHRSSVAAKRLREAMPKRPMTGLSDVLLPSAFTVGAKAWSMAHLDEHAPPFYNVIVSTVPGPPTNFYAAGARIEAMFPLGPLLYGGGLNISAFTHGDSIDVGIVSCPELLADPWVLAERFGPALDELAAVSR